MKVAIINYGMGNLDSIARAVELCGGQAQITNNKADIKVSTHIILPGVGSFADGMNHIDQLGLKEVLREEVLGKRIPLLGICLGLQILADWGYEGGKTAGLGFIAGEVIRFKAAPPDTRIPHMGWNEVYLDKEVPLFSMIPSGKDFYFAHSYHFRPGCPEDVMARTHYGEDFVSAIKRDHIHGVQFHPEKSQRFGLQLIKNFLAH